MLDLTALTTESRNKETMNLDEMSPLEIARAMNREDEQAVLAVRKVLPQIAAAISWAAESLKAGGRIIYLGAGTSGRLGVLDAAECPPTFGVSPDTVVGIIAGGEGAFIKAREGVEDSVTLGEEDLKSKDLTSKDIVIGLAASGRTPYVIYGLQYAKRIGCRTVAIVCNLDSPLSQTADLAIEPVPGPEVLTGSTRLKAGTVQKLILNMISTGSMVGIGKVYQNLMVDVQQTNEKLKVRAQNIVMDVTDCSRERAAEALEASGGEVKTAIVMISKGCDPQQAKEQLEKAGGHIRQAIRAETFGEIS